MQIPVKFFMLSLSISLIITGMMIGVWNFTIEGLKDLIDPVTSLLALLATAILLGFMYVQIDSQIKQHRWVRKTVFKDSHTRYRIQCTAEPLLENRYINEYSTKNRIT